MVGQSEALLSLPSAGDGWCHNIVQRVDLLAFKLLIGNSNFRKLQPA